MKRKQSELFKYIKTYIQQNDFSPSYDEMMKAVNLKSKSGIHRLVNALEKQKKIKRIKYSARTVEIHNG